MKRNKNSNFFSRDFPDWIKNVRPTYILTRNSYYKDTYKLKVKLQTYITYMPIL